MIYTEVTPEQFKREFRSYGRGEQFSWEALEALFEYYDDLYFNEPGYRLDVISICCDWTEFESWRAVVDAYNSDVEDYTQVFILDNGNYLVHNC